MATLALQKKWAEERREKEAQLAEAQRQAIEEQARQQAEAERAQLLQLRQQREAQEVIERLTPEERAELEKHNPMDDIREWYQTARQEEEREFMERVQKEYEQELIDARSPHLGLRTHARQQAEARMQAKIQEWQKDRETRELQAEKRGAEHERLVYSLGDRGRMIFSELVDKRPDPATRVQQVRQAVAQKNIPDLTQKYIQEVKALRGQGWKIKAVREAYRAQGVNVDGIDFTSFI